MAYRNQNRSDTSTLDRVSGSLMAAVDTYSKQKAVKESQSIINDPNSSPIQKAMALANIGQEKLGTEVYKKAADTSVLSGIEQDLNIKLGRVPTPEPTGRTPNIRPNEPTTTTQPGFSPAGPHNAATNAMQVNQPREPVEQQQQQALAQPQATVQGQPQQQPQIDPIREAEAYDQAAMQAAKDFPAVAARYENKANEIRKSVRADSAAAVKKFEGDRKFARETNKTFHDQAESIQNTIPKAEMIHNLASQAVESGKVGPLSRANLAKRLGIKELNTAEGAALDFAIKENLITNISRVTAKATNKWLEQVSIGAYAQTGETQASNRVKLEASKAELDLAKAKLDAYNQVLQNDLQEFGAEQPYMSRRAEQILGPIQKDITDRAAYKTRRIIEQENGTAGLMKTWNQSVPQGTPLTPEMGKVILDKTGDWKKAAQVAKELGYTILPAEQIATYE